MIGSTDSHTGLTAVEEDNFMGKTVSAEPSAERWEHAFVSNPKLDRKYQYWETAASGYAAVWATDNTREAIFDAMAQIGLANGGNAPHSHPVGISKDSCRVNDDVC